MHGVADIGSSAVARLERAILAPDGSANVCLTWIGLGVSRRAHRLFLPAGALRTSISGRPVRGHPGSRMNLLRRRAVVALVQPSEQGTSVARCGVSHQFEPTVTASSRSDARLRAARSPSPLRFVAACVRARDAVLDVLVEYDEREAVERGAH